MPNFCPADAANEMSMAAQAANASMPRSHEDISFPFGKNKNVPLSRLNDNDVRWFHDAVMRDLADPAKERWRAKATLQLATVEAELRFRGLL